MAEVTEVVTDKGKVSFLRLHSLDPANSLNGFMLINITTQTIYRICRINDDASALYNFYDLPDQTILRILRMNCDQHERLCLNGKLIAGKWHSDQVYSTIWCKWCSMC